MSVVTYLHPTWHLHPLLPTPSQSQTNAIAEAKASLQTTYQAYQRSCPPEAQLASEYMGDSVALFYGALTNLEEYIDCCEDELLILARSEAVQAGELLERALDWAESVANSNNPHQMY